MPKEANRTTDTEPRREKRSKRLRRARNLIRAVDFYDEGRAPRWPAEFGELPGDVQAALVLFVRRLYGWMGRTPKHAAAVEARKAYEHKWGVVGDEGQGEGG